jgi:NAD(P)-dependent dehydrogenase (short-subunit alcohol dehydrogenase family)/phosphopantetheinyl transferase/acyl carrier protein/3-hydroxymyristoyl/3-hydroxydecanoyl-(acyl carrier protein) dehydratase
VISEKTGYGVDELETDYELEADLGIDTVKQAEIFGQVREQYGLAPDENFRLADYPTIEALAGWLSDQLKASGGVSVPAASPAAPEPSPSIDVAPVDVAPVSLEPSSVVESGDVDVLSDLLSVISEKTGYGVDELETDYELEADLGIDTVKQAEIFGQVREQYGLAPDENFRLADYPTIEALAGWLSDQLKASGSAVTATPEPATERPPSVIEDDSKHQASPEGEESTAVESTNLPPSFRIRRPVLVSRPPWAMGSVKGRTIRVIGHTDLAEAIRQCVASKGGSLEGIPDAVIDAGQSVMDSFEAAQKLDTNRPKDWICAANSGDVAVSLKDGRDVGARAGFAKAIGREWPECAARLVNVNPSMDVETAAALAVEELAAHDGSVEVHWNEQGRHAIELSMVPFPDQNQSNDKHVIVLTGGTRGITAQVALAFASRGPCKLALLARTAPGVEAYDERTAKAEAKAEIERAGQRATPAAVKKKLAPLIRAEEARSNIEAMKALGAEVEFFRVDLSDEASIRSVLDDIRGRWGAIEVLVHGAGVEESRLIADKDETAFRRVFDGKARGGLALAEALEPDAFFVSMGSVAGRFGNPGQVDYSAANEAMAQVCLARPQSLHVDWTAWGDVGMAVRGGMDKLLDSRGVEMLPAGPGSNLVVDMVSAGISGEVVVAGKLGDFGIEPAHPLIDAVEMDGDVMIARRALSLTSDPWIIDHAIDGKPVLPGVIGLEMMAAVAMMADPGHGYAGAESVEFKAPVKLHGDATTDLIITAKPVDDGVLCTLSSSREARTGRIIKTEHFAATIKWQPDDCASLPPMGLADHAVDQTAIYQRFFHGPAFQVLDDTTGVTTDALSANGHVRHLSIAGGLLTSPLVLEAAFQAAGLHRMMVDGVMALPQSIERVVCESSVRDDEPLHLAVRRDGDRYDVDVVGEKGRVLALRGFAMVEAGPLPPGGTFNPPKGGWSAAVIARVKATGRSASQAKALLSEAEREKLLSRGTDKRQSDRLLGRMAAKQAISELTGMRPSEFQIDNRESGEPYVVATGEGDVPHVSISHRDGEAVAVATRTGRAGIDMERVESRAPSFSETWFRMTERNFCQGNPRRESQVWAIKEAVLKVLGTGLRLDPRDVEVLDVADGRASVRLWGGVATRHAALGGGELTVDIEDEQTVVIAVAWMAS